MRLLAACSLGGAGHLGPLLPFLDAARRGGHDTLVVAPPGLAAMVEDSGHDLRVGGAPPEDVIAPLREQLHMLPAAQASEVANRDIFGRLATVAMLPAMEEAVGEWKPDVVLRDPCEYAAALAAWTLGVATAQVGIGLADVEWVSIRTAAPVLEAHRHGLVERLRQEPYRADRRGARALPVLPPAGLTRAGQSQRAPRSGAPSRQQLYRPGWVMPPCGQRPPPTPPAPPRR